MALSMMSMLGCKVKEFQKFSRIFQLGVCSVQNKRIIHASPVVCKKENPTPQEGYKIEKAVKDVASQFGENKAEVEADLTKQVNKVMNGKDNVGKKTLLKGKQKSKKVMKETVSKVLNMDVGGLEHKEYDNSHMASDAERAKKEATEANPGYKIEKAVKDVASQFGENKAEVEADLTKQVNKVMNGKDNVGKKTLLKGKQKSKKVMKETVSKVLNMDVGGLEHKEYDNSHMASDAERAQKEATEANPGNKIEKAVKDVASQFGENKAEVEADLTKQVNKVMNGKDNVGKKTLLKGKQKSKKVMKETVSKVLNMDVGGLEHKEYDNSHMASDAERAQKEATEANPGEMSKSKSKRSTKLKSDDDIKGQQTKQDERNFQRKNLKQKREVSVMKTVRGPDTIVGKTRKDLSRSLPKQRVRTSRLKKKDDYERRKINLFGAEALKIFDSKEQKLNKVCDNTFHEKLEDESAFKFQTNLIPLNGFQEMIQQTLEGKLWRFPIDNEQDWESEENVPFHEHVFLEDAIEDFPKQGPIRNFMELVIRGLSKNPYLTVKEKHEHIDWYRQYFKQPEKQAVLLEALGERAKFTELKQLGAE